MVTRLQNKHPAIGSFDLTFRQKTYGIRGIDIGLLFVIDPEIRSDDVPFRPIKFAGIEFVCKQQGFIR